MALDTQARLFVLPLAELPMIRLLVFSLLALGLSLSLTTAANRADAKIPKDSCVKPCLDCGHECLDCMKHCKEAKMDDLARECDICHHTCMACGLAVGGKNPHSWALCELCEKLCSDCAAECDKHPNDHTKKCAEACRSCAKACADARK